MVTNHIGHGHYISKTGDIKGLVAELLGKEIGCSGGMGGSQHLYNKNFLSNGIQGGMVPIACGIAKYYKLQKQKNISVAFIGDGTLGEGIIYETFNIAAKKEYPLLIVLESNGMAQSTSTEQTFSGDMQKRIEGFGSPVRFQFPGNSLRPWQRIRLTPPTQVQRDLTGIDCPISRCFARFSGHIPSEGRLKRNDSSPIEPSCKPQPRCEAVAMTRLLGRPPIVLSIRLPLLQIAQGWHMLDATARSGRDC